MHDKSPLFCLNFQTIERKNEDSPKNRCSSIFGESENCCFNYLIQKLMFTPPITVAPGIGKPALIS